MGGKKTPMKIFRRLLLFLIPLLILPLLYLATFVRTPGAPTFIGLHNYLRLFVSDPVFWLALRNTLLLPLLIGVVACAVLLLFWNFLFKRTSTRLFSGMTYGFLLVASTALGFGRAVQNAIVTASSPAARIVLNAMDTSAFAWSVPSVLRILFSSLEIGVFWCLLFWLGQKAVRKICGRA